jgi:hypothetical protein
MLDSVRVDGVRKHKKDTEAATTILCGDVSYSRNVGDRIFVALSDREPNHSLSSIGDL